VSAFGTSSRDGGSDGWYEDTGRDPYAGDTRPYRRQRAAKPAPKRRSKRRWPRRLGKTLLVLIVLLVVVAGGLWVFTPSVSNAPALVQEQAVSHGISYPGVQPPQRFTQALVATEDKRFYTNPGVDLFAVARLAWGNVTGHPDQGGSTLEQQLAKNLYTNGRSGFLVEAEQVVLAVKLNLHYTKPQILQMYAEIAYYGNNYYGLQQASCGYFGVQPAELSWPEAALLAGVVNAPTVDDPRTNPQNARNRETHVVDRLVAVGTLNQAQAKLVLAENLNLVPEGTGCRS
jgi:hypothetical protein